MPSIAPTLPTTEDIANGLRCLSLKDVRALAATCGVSYLVLWSIRRGNTRNPRLETVGRLWPHLAPASAGKSPAEITK